MDNSSKKTAEVIEIINKFTNLIRKVIRKTSPKIDQVIMDDIEQEIKIKIWKEFIKSEKKILYPYSYIRRVAYTTTARMMQKISKERMIVTGQLEEHNSLDPNEGKFAKEELLQIIDRSIDSIVDSRGKVLKLHLLGMKIDEIARILSWTNDKVRNLLYRGLADLKEKLRIEGIDYTSKVTK